MVRLQFYPVEVIKDVPYLQNAEFSILTVVLSSTREVTKHIFNFSVTGPNDSDALKSTDYPSNCADVKNPLHKWKKASM